MSQSSLFPIPKDCMLPAILSSVQDGGVVQLPKASLLEGMGIPLGSLLTTEEAKSCYKSWDKNQQGTHVIPGHPVAAVSRISPSPLSQSPAG
ncbi:unnamed protein product [Arctogadus glacialis]